MLNCLKKINKKIINMISNSDGVTLLELVVALAILALVLSPFYAHFVQSIKMEHYTKDVIKGEYIAQRVLENEKQLAGITFKDETNYDEIRDKIDNLASGVAYTTPYIEIDDKFVKITYMNESATLSDDNTDLYELPNQDFGCTPRVEASGDIFLDFLLPHWSNPVSFKVTDPSKVSVKLINKIDSITGDWGTDYELWISNTNDVNWTPNPDPNDWKKVLDFSHINNVTNPDGTKDTKIAMLFNCANAQDLPSGEDNVVNLHVSTNMPNQVGDESKRFTVYEIDPLKRFEITTNINDNAGQVEIYRGLDEDSYAKIISDQQYYWVIVNVYSSTNATTQRRLAKLHSSVRKKL